MTGPLYVWAILTMSFALGHLTGIIYLLWYVIAGRKKTSILQEQIEAKFRYEAGRLTRIGYQIVHANSERILLEKLQKHPCTFPDLVWFMLMPMGGSLLAINAAMRHYLRVRAELRDVNGKIELRVCPDP